MKIIRCLAIFLLGMALPATAEIPTDYYQSCNGLKQTALLQALHQKIKNHTNVGYDGLWNVYVYSDMRPEDHTLWDIYCTKHWPANFPQCGNYSKVGDCVNREHSVPKSWWGGAKDERYSDAFHLYPTDGYVNNQRSNYEYGECANGSSVASNGNVHPLGRLGNSTFAGYSGKVFEPDDEYKGDLARSYFYMATCYNDKYSSWTSNNMFEKNSYPMFSTWAHNLLLKWHRQDPVSQKELDRNEAIYLHQHNRNPFIDHPELVEFIWGDKQDVAWSETYTGNAEFLLPVAGTTINFGNVAVGVKKTMTICVRGQGLTDNVTCTVDNSEFAVSAGTSTISATNVNSTSGASVSLSITATSAGTKNGTLTLRSGSLTLTVALTALAVNGLPAGVATNVSDQSFTATWTNIGDADNGKYKLYVREQGSASQLDGYPVQVSPAAESYTVFNLEPSTTYEYWLTSKTLTSNVVTVTTADPMPSINLLCEADITFESVPGEPSPYTEIIMECENITDPIVVSIDSPFELSSDNLTWCHSLTLDPDEDRFYLRVYSENAGTFTSTMHVVSGSYYNDNVEVTAIIAAIPTFLEDFETDSTGFDTYSPSSEYQGTACKWYFNNAGIWSSDGGYNGKKAVRMGSNADSYIEMRDDKAHGAGIVTLYTKSWSSSEHGTYMIQYSTNQGATWQYATGEAVQQNVPGIMRAAGDTPTATTTTTYTQHTFTVNVPGNVRLRVQQTDGGRFMIDDVAVTNYKTTSNLDGITSDYHSWTACCRDGLLAIDSEHAIDEVMIVGVDGIVYYSGPVAAGTSTFELQPMLYIVVVEDFSRRVMIK